MTKILNINPEGINESIFNSVNYEIINFPFPSISFNPTDSSDFNIDSFICQRVISEISEIDCDLIIIPVSLTENFLEFVGLRLAYHIRLTDSPNRYKPIIFLSDINLSELLKLNDLCEILYSDGAYLSKTDETDISLLIQTGRIRKLDANSFKRFVNKINFSAPDNYLSNHSVANEWGISRWSEILSANDPSIEDVKNNIERLLYFKYLLNKYPPLVVEPKEVLCEGKGKVLYIDDEWNKGWKSVLKAFFSSNAEIQFEVVEEVFKHKDSDEIVEMVMGYIERLDPDLIILDLRLADTDFNNTLLKQYTGYKILKEIKALNEGYQVIIFSATSKIWNLMELQDSLVNGFILKEFPDNNIETEHASKSIEKFKKDAEIALTKKEHRNIWALMKKVKEAVNYSNTSYLLESKILIEIAWDLIVSDNLNYAYLALYQAVEGYGNEEWQLPDNRMLSNNRDILTIVNVTSRHPWRSEWMLKYIYEPNNGSYFKIEGQIVTKKPAISALVKVSAACAFRLGKNNDYLEEIGRLNKLRNEIAHSGSPVERYEDIKILLNLLFDIRNAII